jgi:hypothetical protein
MKEQVMKSTYNQVRSRPWSQLSDLCRYHLKDKAWKELQDGMVNPVETTQLPITPPVFFALRETDYRHQWLGTKLNKDYLNFRKIQKRKRSASTNYTVNRRLRDQAAYAVVKHVHLDARYWMLATLLRDPVLTDLVLSQSAIRWQKPVVGSPKSANKRKRWQDEDSLTPS